ncbi:MAG: hypothetical protein ACJA0H_002316 [Francisellaceae bacterium]|jgi:hypothetical protein
MFIIDNTHIIHNETLKDSTIVKHHNQNKFRDKGFWKKYDKL